ncbi:MAG: DMT family transporter [Deltaproteobacteria bacterium]|nr:DMT family transporter [Deltaproteobacteria bacterium]
MRLFFVITSMRYLISAGPLLAIAWWRHGLAMPARDLLLAGLMGVSTFTLCPILMYWGVGLSRAADAAIITATEPLMVSLGALFFLRERLDRRTALALATAFAGAAAISEFWKGSGGSVNPAGTLLISAGVFFEAAYSVIGKNLLRRHPPIKTTAVALGVACAVNSAALTALGWWPAAGALGVSDWLLLSVYLALLCTIVGYTFWFVALKDDAAARVAITIFSQPVIGVLIAWIWVDETPTLAQGFGGAVILAAVAIALGSKTRGAVDTDRAAAHDLLG